MRRILPILVAAGLLAGCNTPATPANPPPAPVPAVNGSLLGKLAGLKQGMSPDEVVALLGEPKERKPFQSAQAKSAELWIYFGNVVRVEERQAQTGTRDVPYVEPISGVQRTIQEPVYSVETITIVQTLYLALLDGKLVEWKSGEEARRSLL